jgi:hypothetical protein
MAIFRLAASGAAVSALRRPAWALCCCLGPWLAAPAWATPCAPAPELPVAAQLLQLERDRLRDMAGQLMRESPAYQGLVRKMGGNPAASAASP